MFLINAMIPALMLYLLFLYAVLLRRFFTVKAKLPVLGLKGSLGSLSGKRRKLAVLGVLFFLISFATQIAESLYTPSMLMVFNYEEAAWGQNPNSTRFNESDILSDDILEQVVQRGSLKLSAEQLAGYLALSTPLDAEKLDVTKESNLKISTEYRVHCSEMVSLYHTTPKRVLSLLADVYWEDFVKNYAENDSILDLSFQELEGMEYLDAKDFLEMQAQKLRNYLPSYSSESSSFRAKESGETFASLSQKIDNFIEIELERYEAFALENGLSRDRTTYQSRMQYANRLLETSQRKEMAAHDVRIEAINMYDAFMTSFVLIPTYDVDDEFYMSRTKVGVDYFADEAKEHLAEATKQKEEIEHNSYASSQVGGAWDNTSARELADQRIEELTAELLRLSAQCRELCSAYVKEKRDGYIQVSFTSTAIIDEALTALFLTGLFVLAWGGNAVLEPFYQEYQDSGSEKGKTKRKRKISRKEKIQEETSP
ncbi:MAG: hypothetical protein K2P02_07710 [Lachnospiraceae bacterium]|nr:hypothetical protein [Lachnospiraceae bacterium]